MAYFDKQKVILLNKETHKRINNILKKDDLERYGSKSHFIRVAINKLIVDEENRFLYSNMRRL